MPIVSMILSANGPGTVPLGAIIPVGNVGAWALPVSGEIKDGYALCDGAAFPSGSHASFIGNRPNLTDDRFLQGSSSVAGTGGANTKTLATTELPAHSHSIDHDHGSANTSTNGSHFHQSGITIAGGGLNPSAGISGGSMDASLQPDTSTEGAHLHSVDLPNYTGTSGSAGSGTAFDIRPKYFNVVYLMRVV